MLVKMIEHLKEKHEDPEIDELFKEYQASISMLQPVTEEQEPVEFSMDDPTWHRYTLIEGGDQATKDQIEKAVLKNMSTKEDISASSEKLVFLVQESVETSTDTNGTEPGASGLTASPQEGEDIMKKMPKLIPKKELVDLTNEQAQEYATKVTPAPPTCFVYRDYLGMEDHST